MKKTILAMCIAVGAAQAGTTTNVGIDDSSAPWLGYMNVFELPSNGGGFVFGSTWGLADLVSNFDDGAGTLTVAPNTIGDPNEFWYQGGRPGENPGDPNDNGGPGAAGNKIMEANLYQESTGMGLNGTNVVFSGMVLSDTFTAAHQARVFIRDFAPDYSSSVDVFADVNAAGSFSISLATIADNARHVQWGIQVEGVNVWVTDVDPFGTTVFSTIPTPAGLAVLGMGGLVATRRRRA